MPFEVLYFLLLLFAVEIVEKSSQVVVLICSGIFLREQKLCIPNFNSCGSNTFVTLKTQPLLLRLSSFFSDATFCCCIKASLRI